MIVLPSACSARLAGPHAVALAWLFGLGLLLGAQAQARPARLAVLEFGGDGVEAGVRAALSDEARAGALDALDGREVLVMTRESMEVLLAEMDACTLEEGACEVETARNIGADLLVTGEVSTVGGVKLCRLKLFSVDRAALLATARIEAKSDIDLVRQVAPATAKMIARSKVAATLPARGAPAAAVPASPPPTRSPVSSAQAEDVSLAAFDAGYLLPGGSNPGKLLVSAQTVRFGSDPHNFFKFDVEIALSALRVIDRTSYMVIFPYGMLLTTDKGKGYRFTCREREKFIAAVQAAKKRAGLPPAIVND